MADYDEPSEDGHDLTWKVLGVVFIILILGASLGGSQISDNFSNFFGDNDGSEGKKTLSGLVIPRGDIRVGEKVVTKGEVVVREVPAGEILGNQESRENAIVIGGPVEEFEKTWWRLDFKKAPDGWVWEGNLTAHTAWFTALNIIPILFTSLRSFFIFLSIIFLFLIIWVILKKSDLKKAKEKKRQYQEEQERVNNRGDVEPQMHAGVVAGLPVEEEGFDVSQLPTGDDAPRSEDVHNKRWSNVQSLINSHGVNDWKQAIIEADIILDEMLEKMGYKGNSIGDKLKTVERSDFITLDRAWEAHKIRNRVAHHGSDWTLSRDDAERTIENYRAVFSEFYYI